MILMKFLELCLDRFQSGKAYHGKSSLLRECFDDTQSQSKALDMLEVLGLAHEPFEGNIVQVSAEYYPFTHFRIVVTFQTPAGIFFTQFISPVVSIFPHPLHFTLSFGPW
jgi:hypothetical protein